MIIKNAIKNLKKYVTNAYKKSNKKIGLNIHRGNRRAISTDIEDGISKFISDILPNSYNLFLDSSIYIDGKKYRPDLLVVNDNKEVVFMMEIKANMGWCRDASRVLEKIIEYHNVFRNKKYLSCKFSNEEDSLSITYDNNVCLVLISFTDSNCDSDKHFKNKEYASQLNIKYYNLFSGWYGNLSNYEVLDFGNDLVK